MEIINCSKRSRDESAAEFPQPKRLRDADVIYEILDDDDEVDVSGAVGDLADVIKSLEEEIASAAPPAQLDLGYLLEASDDDLGLPPAVGLSPASTDGGDVVEVVGDDVAGFDRIWRFDDDFGKGSYCLTEFGDGVNIDGGVFDYSDAGFGSLDAEEIPFWAE